MINESEPTEEVLREAIMTLEEPVLFRKLLRNKKGKYIWKLLEWDLLDIANQCGDLQLPFRCGYNAKSLNPQWETDCSTKTMTFREFLNLAQSVDNEKEWYYFDYKHMHEWFDNNTDILTSLDWQNFGFNKDGSDSTLWIGSKGAHTNCHQDSYGCNLVAQIHGRKEWVLFPPHASNLLKPTRVPYEESTVYSAFNFFSPSKEDESALLKLPLRPRVIELEKGDILFIPNGWWHYVESKDLSISVNIWLPTPKDPEARIKEAIVKLIVAKIGKKVCSSAKDANCTLSYCLQLLDAAIKEHEKCDSINPPVAKKAKTALQVTEDFAALYPEFVKIVPNLNESELEKFWSSKRDRFDTEINLSDRFNEADTLLNRELLEFIIKALCHPDVINRVKDLLINS